MQERPDAGDLGPDTNKMANDVNAQSLEELFADAEALIRRMEEPNLPLEEAFAAYEQGMKIIRACNSRIDQVEQQMLLMNEEGALVPFGEEE